MTVRFHAVVEQETDKSTIRKNFLITLLSHSPEQSCENGSEGFASACHASNKQYISSRIFPYSPGDNEKVFLESKVMDEMEERFKQLSLF